MGIAIQGKNLRNEVVFDGAEGPGRGGIITVEELSLSERSLDDFVLSNLVLLYPLEHLVGIILLVFTDEIPFGNPLSKLTAHLLKVRRIMVD